MTYVRLPDILKSFSTKLLNNSLTDHPLPIVPLIQIVSFRAESFHCWDFPQVHSGHRICFLAAEVECGKSQGHNNQETGDFGFVSY